MVSEGQKSAPIIVCGSARSGTTFVCDLLDSHPDIAMSDEFFLYKTPSLVSFFEEAEEVSSPLLSEGERRERKGQMMKMLWFYAGRAGRLEKSRTSRRFGNKTPGAEHYIEFYDRVFEAHPPLYVYVLRKGEDTFLSVRNTEWGKNAHINGLVNRYLDSIKRIESFISENPGRCFMLQLDRMPHDAEGRRDGVSRLMEFLDEEILDPMVPFITAWKSVHSTRTLRRDNPDAIIDSLSEDDLRFLENNSGYQEVLQRYGYN